MTSVDSLSGLYVGQNGSVVVTIIKKEQCKKEILLMRCPAPDFNGENRRVIHHCVVASRWAPSHHVQGQALQMHGEDGTDSVFCSKRLKDVQLQDLEDTYSKDVYKIIVREYRCVIHFTVNKGQNSN